VDRETLTAFREAAVRFARGEIRPMIGDRGRDGDLSRLPQVLAAAGETGLLSSPDPGHPGHQYGVWGRTSPAEGAAASLAVLEEIAVECAGVGACLHAAGLGTLELEPSAAGPRRPAVAFLLEGEQLRPEGGPHASGALRFSPVLAPPEWDAVVCYRPGPGGWRRWLLPAGHPGLKVEELAPRTGLAAAAILRMEVGGAPPPTAELPPGDFEALLVRWLLGLAALALGAARGAVAAAAAYAVQRRQGGREIAEHPAVQLLLGGAFSRVLAGSAHLAALGTTPPAELGPTAALAARLRIVEDSFQAATDALQVFGGYGYMEDYRVEKRLRDLMTLRGLRPAPDELRRLLAARAAVERP